jgi:uncharacterized protein with NAD-binding domain and iron-sulfur cluster
LHRSKIEVRGLRYEAGGTEILAGVDALLPAGALARPAAELGSSPIVNLHVAYDRRVCELPFVAAVRSPVQFVFDRTESSGLERGQLLAISLSAAADDMDRRPQELRERYLPALQRLLPAARRADVLDFTATREPRATFRAAPGRRRLRPGPRTSVAGVYVAGAWTDTGWPATMEGAVRSGLQAARAVLEDARAGIAREAA